MAVCALVFVIKIMALEIIVRTRINHVAGPATIELSIVPTSVTVASATSKIPGTC